MELELIASGLEFPEGPIAMADGSVVLVEIKRQTLTRVGADGTVDVIAVDAPVRPSTAAAAPATGATVGVASTPDGDGYWLVDDAGVVRAFGTATHLGDLAGVALTQSVVGMAATTSGEGYWLVAGDGGIFSFGDAPFFGSTGGITLTQPVVSMAPTTTGLGYWMVAIDGGVFSFGDARFFGSTGAVRLNQPVHGISRSPTGEGYRMVATDGGVFSFGDAPFYGSTGGAPPVAPIVAMALTPGDRGYWTVTTAGEVFAFGDAQQLGDLRGRALPAPVVGLAANPAAQGYLVVLANGQAARFGAGAAPQQPVVDTPVPPTIPPTTPPTTGAPCPVSPSSFGVGTTTIALTDTSRGGRQLLTVVSYPTVGGAPACGAHPLIVVGHGSGGTGQSAAELHRFLVQAGYVIAAPTFPSGFDIGALARDVSFVITGVVAAGDAGTAPLGGHVDGTRVGYIGTSLGGIVGLGTYQRCCLDPRIDAVVAKIATAFGGSYDWAAGPPLLMINGTADQTISYTAAQATYAEAAAPKALISLAGIGHDLRVGNSTILQQAPLGFFAAYLLGQPDGLARVQAAVDSTAIASMVASW